ncbi:hypothetical protein LINPERPRIM_LOCUS39724 [Linum perenne]
MCSITGMAPFASLSISAWKMARRYMCLVITLATMTAR